MTGRKPKNGKRGWRYRFGENDEVLLPLIDAERARLRDMARRLESPIATPAMRESGEAMLEQMAQLLAKARAAKIGSDTGTQKRAATGNYKAALVKKALGAGADPLQFVSER